MKIKKTIELRRPIMFSIYKPEEARKCNQCGKGLMEAKSISRPTSLTISVCANPECINYALLQIPVELTPDEDKKTKD